MSQNNPVVYSQNAKRSMRIGLIIFMIIIFTAEFFHSQIDPAKAHQSISVREMSAPSSTALARARKRLGYAFDNPPINPRSKPR